MHRQAVRLKRRCTQLGACSRRCAPCRTARWPRTARGPAAQPHSAGTPAAAAQPHVSSTVLRAQRSCSPAVTARGVQMTGPSEAGAPAEGSADKGTWPRGPHLSAGEPVHGVGQHQQDVARRRDGLPAGRHPALRSAASRPACAPRCRGRPHCIVHAATCAASSAEQCGARACPALVT